MVVVIGCFANLVVFPAKNLTLALSCPGPFKVRGSHSALPKLGFRDAKYVVVIYWHNLNHLTGGGRYAHFHYTLAYLLVVVDAGDSNSPADWLRHGTR